jgi:hypothetical protein
VNDHEFNYISNIIPTNEQENKQISVKGEWTLDVGTLTTWVAYNDQTNFFLTDGTSAAFGLYARTAECQADINAQVGGPLPSPTFYAGANSVLPPYSPSRCDGYQYQQRDQEDTSLEIRLASRRISRCAGSLVRTTPISIGASSSRKAAIVGSDSTSRHSSRAPGRIRPICFTTMT